MPLRQGSALPLFPLLLLLWLGAAHEARAAVNVFRDRAAFNAAAQNLSTLDFEGVRQTEVTREFFLDGLRFENIFGVVSLEPFGSNNTTLSARGVGEITQLVIELPPGTTAVGCDQFSRVASVSVNGGGATMAASDASDFVGFTSDAPITTLVIVIDVPEPVAPVVIDDLSFGQRRADGAEPAPLLFVTQGQTERAAALNAVTQTPAPFRVETAHNFSADTRTRLALFLAGVRLEPADAPQVVVRLTDSQQRVFDIQAESVGPLRTPSWLRQVNVLLPSDLAPGDVSVTVRVRGVSSNPALFRVEAP